MVRLQALTVALAALAAGSAFAQNAAIPEQTTAAPSPAAQSGVPHWVGPLKGKPITNACYRKTYIAKSKKCGTGYNFDNLLTCWTQCPLEYPVECGMECLPQNKDCAKEVITKVASVANVALNAATSGVFGEISKAAKGVQTGVMCAQQLYSVTVKIFNYIDEVETGGQVDSTEDQLFFLLSKTDFVVYDLPVAVTTCLGLPQITGLSTAKSVVDVVKKFIYKVIDMKKSGANLADPKNYVSLIGDIQTAIKSSNSSATVTPELNQDTITLPMLTPEEQEYVRNLVGSGVTCGQNVKTVINKIVAAAQDFKKQNPTSATDLLGFAILNSDVVLKDLPAVVSACYSSADGFQNRDQILKTLHVIIDKIIASSSQNGNPISVEEYAITITNLGLDAISLFDPTGLANMAKTFIQPICGPTAYIGDIDDGPADQALGLESVQKAFRGSNGTWAKAGDGQLTLIFKSVDTEDVRVNVLSGGQKVYEVPVKKGTTVTWTKPLTEFQGKTLYLDRWRAGFFGIPGTGGGSLLTWVPSNSAGSLSITAAINPTSFSDHNRARD